MHALILILSIVAIFIAIYFLPQLKGWRTMIFNAVMAKSMLLVEILGYLQAFDWKSWIGMENVPWIILSIGVANIVLRFSTTSAVGQK